MSPTFQKLEAHGLTPNAQHRLQAPVVDEYCAGQTLHGLAKRNDISRSQIRLWIAEHDASPRTMTHWQATSQPRRLRVHSCLHGDPQHREHCILKPHGLHAVAHRKRVLPEVHDDRAVRPEVGPRDMEALGRRRRGCRLDLEGVAASVVVNDQVHLRAGRGPVETREAFRRSRTDEVLDRHRLEAWTTDGMAGEVVHGRDAEQRMGYAAVADDQAGRLHQALADVGVEWLQPAHEEQVNKEIDVAINRRRADAKGLGQL